MTVGAKLEQYSARTFHQCREAASARETQCAMSAVTNSPVLQ